MFSFYRFLPGYDGLRGNLTKQATGTSGSLLNISKEKLKSFSIPLPTIEIQSIFKKILWKTSNVGKNQNILSQKHNNLFNSLTQRTFLGEL